MLPKTSHKCLDVFSNDFVQRNECNLKHAIQRFYTYAFHSLLFSSSDFCLNVSSWYLINYPNHTPICKILLNWQIERQSWPGSRLLQPHRVGWVVTGVGVAKSSFVSLQVKYLWHLQNYIGSLGYCPFNFLFAITSCVFVCTCVRPCVK